MQMSTTSGMHCTALHSTNHTTPGTHCLPAHTHVPALPPLCTRGAHPHPEAAHPQSVVLAACDQPSCCSLQRCDGFLVGAGHGVGELAHDDIAAAEHWGGWDAASARSSCSEKAQ